MSTAAYQADPGFDLGPLTWVKSEIEQSLAKGLAALEAFAAQPDEMINLKHAQTHIHQAAGAVQIVGLDGAIALLEEVERHLARLEKEVERAAVPAHVEAISAACRRLARYLNELTAGEPPVTLKLYPEYEALTRLRGAEGASPTDLFYPDLNRRPPRPAGRLPETVGPGQIPVFMRTQRRMYQMGLLNWLRGDAQGLAAMQRAVRAIEEGLANTPTGSFWWSVGGFLASAAAEGILPSYTVKQLCARIDLQIRRFVEGSTKVADRLRREVLYHVAISEPVTDRVREVQELYGLAAMLPKKVEARQLDFDRFAPLLKRAQDVIAGIKDNWLKVTGGRRELLGAVAQGLVELKSLAAGLHEPALSDLVAALEGVASGSSRSGSISEVVAMEFATGLLLAEDAVGHFTGLSSQFPKQVEAMRRRLDFAQRGVLSLPAADEDLLDETARRAQERMLLAQVAREIQGNLRHVEKVLDAFFRDESERAELPGLAAYTRQIQGAFQILGLTEANELLQLCQKQIDAYAGGAVTSADELELLAESLSGLGFYIEAVEQQRPDAARLLDPFMRRRLGLEAQPPEPPPVVEQSIESTLEATREGLPAVLDRFRASPQDPSMHAELNNVLQALKQDADLVADTTFSSAAAKALSALDDSRMPIAELLTRLEALVPKAAVDTPSPSAETIRLLDAGEEKLDAELSEIFLNEAAEVLATVEQSRVQCESDPKDVEALRAIRRGFHTLKGSGRMVGLLELGEAAWGVEKVLNRWLDEERAAVPELVKVVRDAEAGFGRWIAELQSTGTVHVDDAALMASIAELEAAYPARSEPQPAVALDVSADEIPADEAPVELTFDEGLLGERLVEAAPEITAEAIKESTAETTAEATAEAEPESAAGILTGSIDLTLPAGLASLALPHSEEILVGDTVISESLYQILLEETAQLLDLLRREHSVLEFEPRARPSEAMVRAAHTLTGIHRTAGFPPVAETAHALESALLTLQQHAHRPDSMLPVLADAAQSLADLVDFIGMRKPFGYSALQRAEQTRARLAALQETSGGQTADSETLAAQAALADEAPPLVEQPLAADAHPAHVAADALQPAPEAAAESEAAVEPETAPPAMSETAEPETAEPVLAAPVDTTDQSPLEEPATELVSMHEPVAEPEVTQEPVAEPISMLEPAELVSMHEAVSLHEPESMHEPAPLEAAALPPDTSAPELPVPEPVAASLPATVQMVRPVGDALASVRDDLDPQLLPIFLEEAQELFPRAGALLRDWRKSPADRDRARELRRTLHTLKGSARMAGAMRLGELTHLMESRLLVGDREVAPSADLFEALDGDLDQLAALLDRLHGAGAIAAGAQATSAAAEAAMAQPGAQGDPHATARAGLTFGPETAARGAMPSGAAAAQAPSGPAGADEPAGEAEVVQRATVRVRADIIDRLVNESGEVSIARARIEGELRALKANLLELTNSVIRLRGQVREIEIQAETQIQSRMSQVQEEEGFDPLEFDRYTRFQELSRSLAEGVNDVATVQQALLKNLDDADAALMAQARLSRDVQQQLLAVRTVPFSSLSERLYRVLRQTAKELNKKANLEIRGAQTELDRGVLEKLVAPLEHLLRNALDHGIEDRDARIAAGKTEIGEVAISVRQEGNEIALTMADDGRGLPMDAIRAKAIAAGLIPADTAPTQAQVIEVIFAPGFTTASQVTQISGRGIGMDVVKDGITSLGGRVEVETTPGRGTVFTLYLPLTLAVAQAVLVRAAGRVYALPSVLVEQVQQVKADALQKIYEARDVRWQTRHYPFFHLQQLLGDDRPAAELQRYNPVLLLKSANQYVAIHVDEMLGNQEIVIKNIGVQLARLPGLAGATVLGTGEIVLILNPVQLAARRVQSAAESADGTLRVVGDAAATSLLPVHPAAPARVPYVLIVDDSLTVRKITSRLLTREGYEPGTARDGVDALQVLADRIPDVILLDIEMPRMDGFEFANTVKTDPRLRGIPIIMITSRTADKHRARAAEIGVEAYLGKPYQEEELLRHIRLAVAGDLVRTPAVASM